MVYIWYNPIESICSVPVTGTEQTYQNFRGIIQLSKPDGHMTGITLGYCKYIPYINFITYIYIYIILYA